MKIVTAFILLLFASSAWAQMAQLPPDVVTPAPLSSNTLAYYLPNPPYWLLHFPRHRTYTSSATGNDTTVVATGLAERFSSPYPDTYLDTITCGFSLPTYVDVAGNDLAVIVTGSHLSADGKGVYADYNHVIYRKDLHPSVSDTNHGAVLRITVPHVHVDSAFFITLAVRDTNPDNIKLGIAIDSVTYATPPPFNDNLYRTREVGPSGQVYLFDRQFTGDMDPSKSWYSNAVFTAHVSDNQSSVAALRPVQQSVAVIPNPSKDKMTLTYQLSSNTEVSIHIINSAGITVMSRWGGMQLAGDQKISLDLSGMPSGAYRYEIVAGSQLLTGALQVIH